MTLKPIQPDERVGLFRRLAAILYDSLLLVAILFLAALPTAVVDIRSGTPGSYFMLVYMLVVGYAFFGWFWTHGGQTLGMKTWRFRVERFDGSPLAWRHALGRYVAALLSWVPFGLGFLWGIFHPERLTLHDMISRTRLTRLPSEGSIRATGPHDPNPRM